MAMAVCISSGSFLSPPIRRCSPPPAAAPCPSSLTLAPRSPKWLHPLFLHALASTLSLTLSSSLPAMAAGSPPPPASCQEQLLPMEAPSGPVTNQEIVEEGWRMVEDIFFDARLGHWSPDKWQEMREIVLDRSIITRSKAHDLIRRMLATLDDHYTR